MMKYTSGDIVTPEAFKEVEENTPSSYCHCRCKHEPSKQCKTLKQRIKMVLKKPFTKRIPARQSEDKKAYTEYHAWHKECPKCGSYISVGY